MANRESATGVVIEQAGEHESLYTETGLLRATPPFDFGKTLRFLGEFSPMGGEQEVSSRSLTKATLVNGQTVVYAVEGAGTEEAPGISYTLFSSELISAEVRAAVEKHISLFLGLDHDLRPFYEVAEGDPYFRPVVGRLYGLHHVSFPSLMEVACWAVLGQHIPINVARKMKDAIVETYGGKLQIDGKTHRAFPDVSVLSEVTTEEFARLIKNERKAEYLSSVVKALSTVDEEFLRYGPYDEAERWLRSVRGIGEWSTGFILLRGLGRMERTLVTGPILNAAAAIYGQQVRNPATLQSVLDRYGPYQGYWAYYVRTAE